MPALSPYCRNLVIGCWLFIFLYPAVAFAQDDYVSVRLLRDVSPRTIIVSSTHPVELFSGSNTFPILELGAREKLTITTSNDRVYLSSDVGGIFATSLVIRSQMDNKSAVDEPELTIEVADGTSLISPRSYHGAFKIDVEKRSNPTLRIVNFLPVENYVISVLSSEFGFNELEGSKAMALCIRTLTLRHLTTQSGPEFAVPDNESWQVYRGTKPITPTAIEAASATAGQVLLHDNELIEAVYFASSGGFTANNEDVWNASEIIPYLRGIEDAYDDNSPHHTWESNISRSDLLSHLSSEYDFQIDKIDIHDINRRDQRVRSVLLAGSGSEQLIIPGNEFRRIVNHRFGRDRIKSTMFKLNKQPDLYLFSGGGFGHGVGLNQWGALELSKSNWTYEDIINYYYRDVEIATFLPGMVAPVEASISNNVPFVDLSAPPVQVEPEPVFDSAPQAEVSSGTFASDISSRLFGDEDAGEDIEGATSSGSIDADSQTSKGNQRLFTPDKVVGWTTTTKPSSTPARRDSVKTKTKRRTTGW